MKRILAILLASIMTATSFVGCTDNKSQDETNVGAEAENNENGEDITLKTAVFNKEELANLNAKIAEKTGIEEANNTVITSIGGYELTLAEYEYLYYSYLQSALEYTMYYGFEVLKDEEFISNISEMFKSEIKTAPAILTMASEKGISMTEEEITEKVINSYDILKEQYGERFEAVFASKGTPSLNAILYYNYIFTLYDKVAATYSDPAQVEADFAENYVRAKHILIQFPENEDGSAVTEEQKADAYAEATAVVEKINNGEDFDALITEYNDDPGMTVNTDGYYFTYNEMVPEFETAAFALEDNAVSEIVETSYGYHIIKRLPVDDAFKASETYTQMYDAALSRSGNDAFNKDLQTMADSFERTNVENFDELIAPVVAEAEECVAEYEVQFNAMYGITEETETETETEAEVETEAEAEVEVEAETEVEAE